MIPEWRSSVCLRCVACVGTCPVGAIRFRGTSIIIDREKCTGCGTCVRICPVNAIGGGGE